MYISSHATLKAHTTISLPNPQLYSSPPMEDQKENKKIKTHSAPKFPARLLTFFTPSNSPGSGSGSESSLLSVCGLTLGWSSEGIVVCACICMNLDIFLTKSCLSPLFKTVVGLLDFDLCSSLD